MTELDVFYRFATALAIGFLIGLQRQHAAGDPPEHSLFAGVRTFPLLALVGCAAAFLGAETGSSSPLSAALLVAGILVVAAYVMAAWKGNHGVTTEAAAILTVLLGALSNAGPPGVAVAVGVAAMALLSLKGELHRLADRVTREDVFATLKFGIITGLGAAFLL